MWIIYTQNCRNGEVDLCCYVHEFEKALNAMDDYAISKFRLKVPDYPKDDDPLEEDVSNGKDGYYVHLDQKYQNGFGDAERVNLIKKKGKEIKILRYFQVGRVGKYVDDYLAERTQAVVALQNDDQGMSYINPHNGDSSEDVEYISSDEYSDD